MGSGAWTASNYANYTKSVGRKVMTDSSGCLSFMADNMSAQDIYKSRHIQPELNPKNVMRECCDSEEHPNTIPVILALDVTVSMGGAAIEVAKKLNEVMTKLYQKVSDVEFCVMGIGDLAYDEAPVQISQFESDVRIAEQLDKIYFEGGGGGNGFESYTAAWYCGLRHTSLDCWKRGKKGLIITMGDEPLNPYLSKSGIRTYIGDYLEADIETKDLYEEVCEKFDVYHLVVNDRETSARYYEERIQKSFGKYFDNKHLFTVTLDDIANKIVDIVAGKQETETITTNTEITW